jgi:hypothetical protein
VGYAKSDTSRCRHALRGLLGEVEWAVRDAVETGGRVAEVAARQTTAWKDRSGKTRKTIRYSSWKQGFGFKLTGKGASLFLEGGTAAHLITSENGKMLRFVIGGTVFYRASVYHPGTKATFFLEHAVVEGAQTVSRNLPRLIARAAQKRGLGG